MELDWLETFLAVVDRGGFTAASEHVHRSQSRVSAHIAALERDLGVQLIDRTRRPASLTTAGEVFARHARDIVAGVGSARSAVSALRGLNQASIALLTTPCIGAALLSGVVAEVIGEHPSARIGLAEQGWHDVERRYLADGVAMAVLPALVAPIAGGLHEHVLWRERLRVVVPTGHELARTREAVPIERLAHCPLVVAGTSADVEPEVLRLLAGRDLAARPRVTVDNPQTLLSLVRAGAGVGVINAVALETLDTDGVVVLDAAGDVLVRHVAAYWHDVLLDTQIGRRLQRAVLEAPLPPGAMAPASGNGTGVLHQHAGTGRR